MFVLRKTRLGKVVLAILAVIAAPAAAFGQAVSCKPASVPPDYRIEAQPTASERVPVTGYVLALSWSPEYCRKRKAEPRDRMQCSGENGRFGFILHGLWPEGEGGRSPAWCGVPRKVPPATLAKHLCTTPSAQLIQHEWQKHGSCGWADAERYLHAGSVLFGAVRYPDMMALSHRGVTAGELRQALAKANPGLPKEAVRIRANRRQWLQEVHLCFGSDFRPRPCPSGRGVADPVQISIWRGR